MPPHLAHFLRLAEQLVIPSFRCLVQYNSVRILPGLTRKGSLALGRWNGRRQLYRVRLIGMFAFPGSPGEAPPPVAY